MQPETFEQIQRLAYRAAGLKIPPTKQALVASRIRRRMRDLGLPTAEVYMRHLRKAGREEMLAFIDVLTTNFTHFFRERDHFEITERFLKQRVERGQRRFRLWSAASSSGEEPYSIAMTLSGPLKGLDYKILATDLSTTALAKARAGVYTDEAVSPLSQDQKLHYFDRKRGDWTIKRALKDKVAFRRLNLSAPPFPMRGPLDIIFCRNVMIYFDAPVRQRMITEFERLLPQGGLLMIGHSETLSGLHTRLQTLRPSVYRKT